MKRMIATSIASDRYTLSIGFRAFGIIYSRRIAHGQKRRLIKKAWPRV